MNRITFLLAAICILPLLHACAVKVPSPAAKRSDPLIGKIIDAKTAEPVTFDTLVHRLTDFDVIYLSEKHDNPDQHAAQIKIIKALVKKLSAESGETKKPAIGFEFFSPHHTPDLLNFIDAGKVTHTEKVEKMIEKDLRMKLGWRGQSDTMWGYYFNLIKLAQEEQLKAAGLDLNSSQKKRITKKGMTGITDLEKDSLFSTQFNNDVYRDHMFAIFKAVHCGMGHGKMQARLYDTWLARNDTMAQSITRLHENTDGPVVVIVGGGHTEHNLGIIDRVRAITPDIRQVNIGLTEIRIDPAPLTEYLEPLDLEGFLSVPAADYFWFFQRVSYEDPCVKFRESLKKLKLKSKTPAPDKE